MIYENGMACWASECMGGNFTRSSYKGLTGLLAHMATLTVYQ